MSEHLRVGRRNDPNAFASEVIPFLLEDEPANCLMAAILFIREGLGGQYLATVYDNHGLRGVAFRTPLKLLLSRMDEDAARTLAADAYRAIPELDEVLGPRPEVDAFAAAWSSLTGRAARSGGWNAFTGSMRLSRSTAFPASCVPSVKATARSWCLGSRQ